MQLNSTAIAQMKSLLGASGMKELERARHFAETNRASALGYARDEGYREADEKWRGVVANKDVALAEQAALIAELQARLRKEDNP